MDFWIFFGDWVSHPNPIQNPIYFGFEPLIKIQLKKMKSQIKVKVIALTFWGFLKKFKAKTLTFG
jgi:hypothetical protein